MRLVQQVELDDDERQALSEALVHIRIAFPDDRQDGPEVRAVRHMASGQATTVELVERAETALHALELRCLAESHVEFWQANLKIVPAKPRRVEQAEIGLIRDPEQFAVMMAEVRDRQARDAHAARRVARAALRALPAPPVGVEL